MTECDCLSEEVVIRVYDKKKQHWLERAFAISKFPVYSNTLTIHGKNLEELQNRKEAIKKELELKYNDHVVRVY